MIVLHIYDKINKSNSGTNTNRSKLIVRKSYKRGISLHLKATRATIISTAKKEKKNWLQSVIVVQTRFAF